jgi:hypothetical protein
VKRAPSEAERAELSAKDRAAREERAVKDLARKAAARDAAVAKEVFAGVPRVEELEIEKKGEDAHWWKRIETWAMANDFADFALSSFFSLHRPLNLSTPVPLPMSDEAWSAVFQPPPIDPWANGNSAQRRPEDEIIAPQSTMRLLEKPSSQNPSLQWEILQESPSNNNNSNVRHLDQPPAQAAKTFDDLVAQFRPFHAPPPPEPILADSKPQPHRRTARLPKMARPKHFRTTLDFTETQSPDGKLSYTVTQTPLMPVPAPGFYTPSAAFLQKPDGVRTYMSRVRASQRSSAQLVSVSTTHAFREPLSPLRAVRRAPGIGKGVQMRLISVKRQRKLKMKKHKYKKLMKRTRNLRQRLGKV